MGKKREECAVTVIVCRESIVKPWGISKMKQVGNSRDMEGARKAVNAEDRRQGQRPTLK